MYFWLIIFFFFFYHQYHEYKWFLLVIISRLKLKLERKTNFKKLKNLSYYVILFSIVAYHLNICVLILLFKNLFYY